MLFEQARDSASLWILKPSSLSLGGGLRLIGKKTSLEKMHNCVIQRYILRPHLINGYKYDIRVFACVTSYDPLKIYIYREG